MNKVYCFPSLHRLVIFICFRLIFQVYADAQPVARVKQVLSAGWKIRQVNADTLDVQRWQRELDISDSQWLSVDRMPKQVPEVLLDHGKMPDPRISRNASKWAWVWEKDWVYAVTFDTPQSKGPAFLRFMGVDTEASVYLNGTLIGQCNNMYRRYTFDIRPYLHRPGEKNQLLVLFTGPVKSLKRIEAGHDVLQGMEANKYLRKCRQDFSEYLGYKPNFMKVGIFRDVFLDFPGTGWMEDVYVRPELDQNLSLGLVNVFMETGGEPGQVRWSLVDGAGQMVVEGTSSAGIDSFAFEVPEPELWWPFTHGDPYLYKLRIEMQNGRALQDIWEVNVGFREIEKVVLDENSGEARFAFKVNGKMIFLMGAGWAPLDGLTHRWDRERSDRQIEMAVQANMNVFRM